MITGGKELGLHFVQLTRGYGWYNITLGQKIPISNEDKAVDESRGSNHEGALMTCISKAGNPAWHEVLGHEA